MRLILWLTSRPIRLFFFWQLLRWGWSSCGCRRTRIFRVGLGFRGLFWDFILLEILWVISSSLFIYTVKVSYVVCTNDIHSSSWLCPLYPRQMVKGVQACRIGCRRWWRWGYWPWGWYTILRGLCCCHGYLVIDLSWQRWSWVMGQKCRGIRWGRMHSGMCLCRQKGMSSRAEKEI